MGNPIVGLGLPRVLAWHRGSTGTSVPSARISVTTLGGLQSGTNELIGEDPSVIISLDASQFNGID